MSFSLIPRGVYERVTDISPQKLAEKGIKLVLADLDNTLVPYHVTEPTPEVIRWKEELNACGITLFLLSNSRKPTRPGDFAGKLGIPFIGHAGKPKRKGYLAAMERMGCTPEQTVMVGDQIFTDTWGAHNSGVTPLLVKPIRMAGNPGRYLTSPGRPPSASSAPGDPSYEGEIRPRGQFRQFFQGI